MPNYHHHPIKHGHKTRANISWEYKAWLRIKSRCSRKTDKDYPRYGGRGICVADVWRNDFAAFLRDMGPRPSPEHSIDRLDPNKGYEPGNCRWATTAEQCSENKRDLIPVTVNGIAFKSKADACRHFGIHQATLHWRMKHGYTAEQALLLKKRQVRPYKWKKTLAKLALKE